MARRHRISRAQTIAYAVLCDPVTQFECRTCGQRFDVEERILARYPGWEPAQCLSCRNRAKTGGSGGKSPTRRSSVTASELLTPAEVLERFHDGPTDGVFTDGGAVPNPGPGGWGAVYVVDNRIVGEASGHDAATTNNRMELTALIQGCDLVPAGVTATIYSDSNLAVRSMNEWATGWERRGWKRKTGEIKNLELVQELYYKLQDRPELALQWIRAHDGSRWNEYADALAGAWRLAPDA